MDISLVLPQFSSLLEGKILVAWLVGYLNFHFVGEGSISQLVTPSFSPFFLKGELFQIAYCRLYGWKETRHALREEALDTFS